MELLEQRLAGKSPKQARAAEGDWLKDGALAAGRYRLLSVLGQGGMGRVWLAEDTVKGGKLALKELKVAGPSEASTEALNLAFKQEFYTMSKLQHPFTVAVMDYGVLENQNMFFTMELVEGESLSQLPRRSSVPLRTVTKVLIELAQVLGFIHSRLYVHCDIKSENIRVTKKGIKLMDFGLMHPLGTPSGGALKGTPQYMAPEIPRGGIIDARTDLYSVGVLAYELLTGHFPFQGKTLTEIISQHLEKPPPPVKRYRPVPEKLENIVAKLLAKDASARYQDCNELLADLGAEVTEVQSYSAQASYLQSAEMIGRSQEQQFLKTALQRLLDGKAKSIFVTAPAGTGKTRLLQEFKLSVRLSNIPFFLGQSRAEGQAPLGPMAEALAAVVPSTPPELLQKYGPVLTELIPNLRQLGITPAEAAPNPAQAKIRQFDAVAGWLKTLAETTPFILSIEDLHWADSNTLELLNVVIRVLHETRGMVVGTYRSDEMGRVSLVHHTVDEGSAERLEVAPLTEASTHELVSAMLRGSDIDPTLRERIYRSTKGNPFYVAETLRMLVELGSLKLQGSRWLLEKDAQSLDLPDSIAAIVNRRLATLEGETLTLSRRLAPLGRMLKLEVVKAVAQLAEDRLFPMLDELAARQFLQRVESDYYFSHDLVRRSVYEGMSDELRTSAHRETARAIEKLYAADLPAHWTELSYHFARSDDHPKAIHYLTLAGQRAVQQNVFLEGTTLLAKAADLLEKEGADGPPDKRLVDLWSVVVEAGAIANPRACVTYADKLCTVLEERIGKEAGFQRFYETTQKLASGNDVFGLRRRRLKRIWSATSRTNALEIVPQLVVYRNLQTNALSALGQTARMGELSKELIARNGPQGPLRAAAVVATAVAKLHFGLWEKKLQDARECMDAFEEHLRTVGVMPKSLYKQYAASCYSISIGHAAMGKPLEQEVLERGLSTCRQHGILDWELTLMVAENVRLATAGEPKAYSEQFQLLMDLLRRAGNPRLLESRTWAFTAIYWLQRKERELTREAIAKIDTFAKLLDDAWLRRHAQFYKAVFAADFEGTERTEAEFAQMDALLKGVDSFWRSGHLDAAHARSRLAVRDVAGARMFAERAHLRATTPATANPLEEVLALQCLADVEGGTRGLELAERAVALSQKNGLSVQQGIGLLAVARQALGTNRSRAAEAVAQAEALFTKLDCREWLSDVETFRRKAAS